MKDYFFKRKNIFLTFFAVSLGVQGVFAMDSKEEEIKIKHAFEIERGFTILNRYSFFSAIDAYNDGNFYFLDFYKNGDRQHISVNSSLLSDDFKSIKVSEYEENGDFKYQNDHSYSQRILGGSYSYIFDFRENSQLLLVPHLKFNFNTTSLNNYLGEVDGNANLNIYNISGGLYTLFNFFRYRDSSIFADVLLSLNFDYTNNSSSERGGDYILSKRGISDFNINFMFGFGYKTEFAISKLLGNLSFVSKISFLRVGKKMDSKYLIDEWDLNEYGGDIVANYNSIHVMPSFDLVVNDMFKDILLSRAINTLFFRFKYPINLASDYRNHFPPDKEAIQYYVLYPRPPEGADIALGFGLSNKNYFGYSISYNFNRKTMAFEFNLSF